MFFKNKNTKYLLAFVIILCGSLVYKLIFKGSAFAVNKEEFITEPQMTEMTESLAESETVIATSKSVEESTIPVKYRVYICGQVSIPGVYEIDEHMLLCDVIDLAGGLLSDAPIENINLVYEITGNESIYIPTKDELEEYVYDSEIFRVNHMAGWGEDVSTEISEESEPVEDGIFLVNINTASKEILMTLPGIGDMTADAIISFREGQRFDSVEDIKNVPGIGEGKFSKIQDLICVE